jgi:hypothetical protein
MKPLPYTSASSVKERLPPEPRNIFLQAVASVAHAPEKSMASARNPTVSDPIRIMTRMATERKFNAGFLISRSAKRMTACLKPIGRDEDWQNKYMGAGSNAMAGLRPARKRESHRLCPVSARTSTPIGRRANIPRIWLLSRSRPINNGHSAPKFANAILLKESQPKGTAQFQT